MDAPASSSWTELRELVKGKECGNQSCPYAHSNTKVKQKQTVCELFLDNNCNLGKQCLYSHNSEKVAAAAARKSAKPKGKAKAKGKGAGAKAKAVPNAPAVATEINKKEICMPQSR